MDISSASLNDYVLINANVKSLYSKRYNCEKEINTLSKRLDNTTDEKRIQRLKERIAIRKLEKGCGIVLNKVVDTIEDIEFKTCLCKLKHPLLGELLRISDQFDMGNLPFEGGVLDQPAQVCELIEITKFARHREQELNSKKERVKDGTRH